MIIHHKQETYEPHTQTRLTEMGRKINNNNNNDNNNNNNIQRG